MLILVRSIAIVILTAITALGATIVSNNGAGGEIGKDNFLPVKRFSYTNSKNALTGMEFVFVPGGCFRMGSDKGNNNERPVHDVCISDFFIGKFEITQGQWRRVMGNNPSRFSSCGDDCPVEQVGWNDIQEFISKLNKLTGKTYYLPTEAEWEYACRSAGRDEVYCGGDDINAVAWYDRTIALRTHPVGQKQPNKLGIYDMSGNVWEWVQDWNGDYSDKRQQDPLGPASGSTKVRRGGSWHYGPQQSRAAWRSSGYPDDRAFDLGFRIMYPGP